MSDCMACRWSEMTPRERFFARLREAVFGPDPRDTIAHLGHAYAGMARAMAGGSRITDYDRHRERFEKTGDPAELERMLRHVVPAE